ncbi:MAG: hypothetical protein ABIG68_09685 [Acidobacteriota bacterium]
MRKRLVRKLHLEPQEAHAASLMFLNMFFILSLYFILKRFHGGNPCASAVK